MALGVKLERRPRSKLHMYFQAVLILGKDKTLVQWPKALGIDDVSVLLYSQIFFLYLIFDIFGELS
jgi:hypothetical protein